LLPLDVRF